MSVSHLTLPTRGTSLLQYLLMCLVTVAISTKIIRDTLFLRVPILKRYIFSSWSRLVFTTMLYSFWYVLFYKMGAFLFLVYVIFKRLKVLGKNGQQFVRFGNANQILASVVITDNQLEIISFLVDYILIEKDFSKSLIFCNKYLST